MHISRVVVIIGVIAVVVGAVLPWASLAGLSYTGLDGDGLIAIALAAVALALAVVGDRLLGLGPGRAVAVLLLGVLTAAITVLNLRQWDEAVDVGLGVYLTLVGGLIAALGGATGFRR
jgi:hypothetical protein